MFVDEKSKSLIQYLSSAEPSKINGKYIYPVPSLVSSFDPDQNHWSQEYLKPYLVTLQELGLITSFHFVNRPSVQIDLTARLLHFDEYQEQSHTAVCNILCDQQQQEHSPHPEVIRPNDSKRRKSETLLVLSGKIFGFLVGFATIIQAIPVFLSFF